jgi:hypothetical protein
MHDACGIGSFGVRGTHTQEKEREEDDGRELGWAGHCARIVQPHNKFSLFSFSFSILLFLCCFVLF